MVKDRRILCSILLMVGVWSLWATGYTQEHAPDVNYVPTPVEVVMQVLQAARVSERDLVYDLGCGDGRIVITAAKVFGARGVGVDIDPVRIKESNENAQKVGVTDRVKFMEQDLFKTDFREATVVFLYLLPELNLQLRPKLFSDLRPGTRIVSHEFDMGDWKPDTMGTVRQVRLYYNPSYPTEKDVNFFYWVIPANVGGTWRWSLSSPMGDRSYTVRLVQKFQEISGTVSVEGKELQVLDPRFIGDQLSFALGDDTNKEKPVMRFNGRVSGDTIQGLVETHWENVSQIYNWIAKRSF